MLGLHHVVPVYVCRVKLENSRRIAASAGSSPKPSIRKTSPRDSSPSEQTVKSLIYPERQASHAGNYG